MYKKYSQITNSSNNLIFLYMSLFDCEQNIRKIRWKDIVTPVNFSVTSKIPSTMMFFDGKDISKLIYKKPTEELKELFENFSKQIFSDDFYIDPEKDISSQLGDVLKSITDRKFVIDDMTIKFDNHIHHMFENAYGQFMLRCKMGIENFQHPERVCYLHIFMDNDIHWFYPIEYILKS